MSKMREDKEKKRAEALRANLKRRKVAQRGKAEIMESVMDREDRYKRGWDNLKKIDGEAGEKVVEGLKDIAPDFGRFLIEFPFGDVYNRDALNLREREVATIAALTAMGNAQPQLKVHIKAGLNVGLTQEEIVEIIMQMSVYSGFPSALNGLMAAKEVFEGEEQEG